MFFNLPLVIIELLNRWHKSYAISIIHVIDYLELILIH